MTTSFPFFQASVAAMNGATLDLNRLTAALPAPSAGSDVPVADPLFRLGSNPVPTQGRPSFSMASLFRKPEEIFATVSEGGMKAAGSDPKIDQPVGSGLSPSSLRIHAESVDDVEMLDVERESFDRERRFAELILDLQAAEPHKFESVLDLFRHRRMGLGANAALDPSDEIALVKFLFFESPPVFPTREGTEDVMESEGPAGQMDLESEIEAILNKSVESSQWLMERILLSSLQPPEGPSPDHPTLMEPEDAVRSELLVGLQEFAGKLATSPSLVGLVASLNARQQKFLRDVLRILRGADASGHREGLEHD